MTPHEVLRLPPDADEAAIKAAYRRLAMQYHPDRNSGDAEATARMKEVNEAYEALTKGRAWDGEYVFVIQLIIAIAGAGKTREYARLLSGQAQAHVVIAAPTIALIGEIEQWLQDFGVRVPVTAIHSGDSGRSVQERIGKWFEQHAKQPDPRGGILVVSHAAVLEMVLPPIAASFDLTIDEIPDIFTFGLKQIGFTHWWVTRYVTALAYRPGVLRLQPSDIGGPAYEKLKLIARNRPYDEGQAVYAGLAAAVADPHKWVLVLETQWRDLVDPHSPRTFAGELDILTILHPDRFRAWRSMLLMGARAQRTMTHLLWSTLFNTKFKPHPMQAGLPSRHTNGHRLTLRYFFQKRATRSMLNQKSKTGQTMQLTMCRSVATYFGPRRFLWSLPQPTETGGVKDSFWRSHGAGFEPSLRLPGRSLGLNEYRDHANLALLSVTNFSPQQYALLERLGLQPEAVTDAFAFTTLYQDLMRSNLRVPDGRSAVECVVPCLPSATALVNEIEGCEVEKMPADLIPELAGRQHGPAPSGSAMSDAERQRRHRARMREEQERHRQAAKEAA